MKADDIMSVNVVAAKDNVTAVEITARLELEAFNGIPIIDNTGIVIGMVTTIESLRAMRDGNFSFFLVILPSYFTYLSSYFGPLLSCFVDCCKLAFNAATRSFVSAIGSASSVIVKVLPFDSASINFFSSVAYESEY